MIERIEVDTFVKELGEDTGGMSRPVQIIGSNGKDYLLKNQRVYNDNAQSWEHWDCMFIQEILVYRIAKFLNIPIPDCVIANVDQLFITHAPSLAFNHRYVPGFHFGSNVLEGVENNLMEGYQNLIKIGKPHIKRTWNHFFSGIVNKEDIPKIIILDLLTANFDRFGNTGNLLVASPNGERIIYCIDHGHCFGGAMWNNMFKRDLLYKVSPTPEYTNNYINTLLGSTGYAAPLSGLGEVFRALDVHIDVSDPDNHCFNESVLMAERITPQIIDHWFSDIPDEWFVDKVNQVPVYRHFIMEQKQLLRWFITFMVKNRAFQSYRGGELNWNVKHTGTQ